MPPITLFRYIFRRLTFTVAALFVALAGVILLADLIESLRFAGKYDGAGLGFALQLTLLRTPSLSQSLTPFVVLFASLWMFAQLNRRSELAVMRSAGLSIWRVISPAALVAAVIGAIFVLAVDPLATKLLSDSETMKNNVRGKQSSLLRVFGDGIWLRQRDDAGTLLINAASVDEATATLNRVTVWRVSNDHLLIERIDAPSARITGRRMEMNEAITKRPDEILPRKSPVYFFATRLSAADFREAAPAPETMSVWQLPRYVVLAEATGLPTIRYNIRFHDLCSTPLKLVAMVLIAALFSFSPIRAGGGFQLALIAVGAGFGLYLLSEIATALGESGAVPALIAAWTPALVATTIAISGLLHLEDG